MKTLALWAVAPVLSLAVLVSGCSRTSSESEASTPAPWVRTVAIDSVAASPLVLSGTVRARQETPLAFQLSGRILSRHVQAGQTVRAGQLLFVLDPRDVTTQLQAATAQLSAAEAALANAVNERDRQQALVAQGFVSTQSLDRVELAVRHAQSQRDSAQAATTQARNLRSYTEVRAPRDGLVVDVMAEAGQVVNAGQPLATLAHSGEREVEVFLPQPYPTPAGGVAMLSGQEPVAVSLREIAGAADPQSRTWRARYRLPDHISPDRWALGALVRVTLQSADGTNLPAAQRVPLSALDERAEGARLWRVVNGQAEPVPVTILKLDTSHAHIQSSLAAGDRIVALGTHRLTPGMAVRELAP